MHPSVPRARSSRSVWLVTALAMLASLLAVPSTVSAAVDPATLSVAPDRIWDVDTRSGTARHTGVYRTLVWDLAELDGVMYVGGDFTEVVAPDGTRSAHSFLAAFDATSGAWLPGFDPDLDGLVYSLTVTDDGSLVAGGEFTGGVALLDPATGARRPGFEAGLRHSWGRPAVFSVAVDAGHVYAGGRFVRAGQATVENLVKLDLATGDPDPDWRPSMQAALFGDVLQQRVYDLEVDRERHRVYVGGLFASVNDDPRTDSLAILDADTGATAAPNPDVRYDPVRDVSFVYDVALDGDVLRYGGKENFTISVDADSLQPVERVAYTNNGDHQVIHPGGSTIWIGCHCWRNAFVAEPPANPFRPPEGSTEVRAVFGIDRATGDVLPITFDVGGSAGAWDIVEASDGRLWVGGEFTRGGAFARRGFVRFSPQAGLTASLDACVARRDGAFVDLAWEGRTADTRVVIRRSVNGSPFYWRGRVDDGTSMYLDSDRDLPLSYTVEARVAGVIVAGPIGCVNEAVAPSPEPPVSTLQTKDRIVLRWSWPGPVEILRDGDVVGVDDDGWFTDRTVSPATTYDYAVRDVASGAISEVTSVSTE